MHSEHPSKQKKSRPLRGYSGHFSVNINVPMRCFSLILFLLKVVVAIVWALACYRAIVVRPVDFITAGSTVASAIWVFWGQRWLGFLTPRQQTVLLGMCFWLIVGIGYVLNVLVYHNTQLPDFVILVTFPVFFFLALMLISRMSRRNDDPDVLDESDMEREL